MAQESTEGYTFTPIAHVALESTLVFLGMTASSNRLGKKNHN
jgi:hypothetical protein